MRKIVLLFLLFAAAWQTRADIPYNAWWQKANGFYQEKNYDSAVFYYEKLSSLSPDDAAIFYNLGNSYYKLNNIGKAVLSYERALKIEPGFKNARENLELAQSRISNRILPPEDIFFVRWWKKVTSPSLSGVWAVASLILFLSFLAILAFRRWGKAPAWLRPQVAGITAFLFLAGVTLAYFSARKNISRYRAVVISGNVPLQENQNGGKTISLVPEGTVVRIQAEKGHSLSIKLPNGSSGWVPAEAVEKI